jgi:hypothetical protein
MLFKMQNIAWIPFCAMFMCSICFISAPSWYGFILLGFVSLAFYGDCTHTYFS